MAEARPPFSYKRKFDYLSDNDEPGPSAAVENPPQPPARVINLAPHENLSQRRSVPPIKIYAGSNIYLEIKEFRRSLYVGLYKEENGTIKNRFNFPVTLVEKVEEGLRLMKEHVENNGQ